jgi:hypothetical protein
MRTLRPAVIACTTMAFTAPVNAQMPDSVIARLVRDPVRWVTLGASDEAVYAIDTRTMRVLSDNVLLPDNVREAWVLAGFRTPMPIPESTGVTDRVLMLIRYDCAGHKMWGGTVVQYLGDEQVGRSDNPDGFNSVYGEHVWEVVIPGSGDEALHGWVCGLPESMFTRADRLR